MRAVLNRWKIEIPDKFRLRHTTSCLDFISDYAEPWKMTTTQLRNAIGILSKSKEDMELISRSQDVELSGTRVEIPGEDDYEASESICYHRSLCARFCDLVSEIDDELER